MTKETQQQEEKNTEKKVAEKKDEVVKTEDKKETTKVSATSKGASKVVAKSVYGERKNRQRRERRDRNEKKDEFDQRILDIARVTRVMAGGKRMNFRACVGIGDKKGRVAVGLGKGADVSIAVNKAVNKAKKDIVTVSMVNETIPHEIYNREGAAKILFKPARQGRGVIAGGVVRVILELAGVKNISAKILGTNNKVNNARCAVDALRKLKKVENNNENKNTNAKVNDSKKEVKKIITDKTEKSSKVSK
ncbi:30S ribosomal protein S5 [bacterium]|nr:30S ribosomal protein S5 [bacterium]